MRPVIMLLATLTLTACANNAAENQSIYAKNIEAGNKTHEANCAKGPAPGMEYSWSQACGKAPTEPPTAQTEEPKPTASAVDERDWCTRHAPACAPLIPLLIPLVIVGEALDYTQKNGAAIFLDNLANTNTYSDRIKTPNGTYNVNTTCVYSNCDTTIKRR